MQPAQSGTGLKLCINSTSSGIFCAAFYQLNFKTAILAQIKRRRVICSALIIRSLLTPVLQNIRQSVETA